MIYYTVCVPPCLYKNKCHWENFIKSFFSFWSKWVTIQFNLATGQRLINYAKFSSWIILFQKKSKSHFKKHLEAYLYHFQIKFKHKIPLSSTYIIKFYKGDSPLGRKGKRVHSCNEWNSVAKNDYINRTIARWCHLTTTTRILEFVVFLCKLRLLFCNPQRDWQI